MNPLFLLKLLYTIIILWIGFCIGRHNGAALQRESDKKEAVLNGHAQWISDENGKPQFKWK